MPFHHRPRPLNIWLSRSSVPSDDEQESLEETLDILQDETLMEALGKSEDDVKAGRCVSLKDLRKRR